MRRTITTERETILFSETDLIRMGLNRHDAKYLLRDYGTEAYQLGTRRNFITKKTLEECLGIYHRQLIEYGGTWKIVRIKE